MIVAFHDQGTEDIFNGKRSRVARATCPETLWQVARRKLDQLNQAGDLRDLRLPPGNRLEALTRQRQGQHPHQRSVPHLLRMDPAGTYPGRAHGLPLNK